jgi:L-arabinose isomerase
MKIGTFAIGLNTYWNQFDGLLENLEGYHGQLVRHISSFGMEVFDAGMVDDEEKARSAGKEMVREEVDLIFLFISTYALSSTVLPVLQAVGKKVILLNIQPTPGLDFKAFNALGDRGVMTGKWLENCQACSIPEIACVCNKAGISYEIISGYLNDPESLKEMEEWVKAFAIKQTMSQNRVGILGHYYNGMLDVYSDVSRHSSVFGNHFQHLEMCELKELRDQVSEDAIDKKIDEFRHKFRVSEECGEAELTRAARTAVALDLLVEKHHLGSMAYYYEGRNMNSYEDIVTSIIAGNTLLTGRNVPVAGECEIKNVQAMKILDTLGIGGSFSEFYYTDYENDLIYLGHDGPAHFSIAKDGVDLVPLSVYHGKPGKGLSIQMTVQNGPVTLLAVVEDEDRIKLMTAQGHAVEAPTFNIGNTNSAYRFDISSKEFISSWSKRGPSHHLAIGLGHHASIIQKYAFLLDIEHIEIC